MKKKYLLIFVFLVILFVGIIMTYGIANDPNTFKVGSTKFPLPDGFYSSVKVTTNVAETIKISDGKNEIYIVEYKDGNLNKSIEKHINLIKKNNLSVSISNFDVNNIKVYKSNIVNDSHTLQYWFINDGKLFSIYTWNGNENTDSIVRFLIESMQFSLF